MHDSRNAIRKRREKSSCKIFLEISCPLSLSHTLDLFRSRSLAITDTHKSFFFLSISALFLVSSSLASASDRDYISDEPLYTSLRLFLTCRHWYTFSRSTCLSREEGKHAYNARVCVSARARTYTTVVDADDSKTDSRRGLRRATLNARLRVGRVTT